jgi:multicomponent K+:H+ antiporter subunit E
VRRWLPYPLLTASLLVMWLLLTQSFSPGQLLLGGGIAILATHAMAALRPQTSRIRRPGVLFKLAGMVAVDILRSNLAVAGIVLFARRERVAGFVRVPLDLSNRHGLTLLALIITATPGTIWVEFDRRRGSLLVHVLDLVDEDGWVRLIKGRYETLLLEIFER